MPTPRPRFLALALALALAMLTASPMALAIDGGLHEAKPSSTTPSFGAHIDVLQHLDTVIDASDPAEEIDEAYAHAHMDMGVFFTPEWALVGGLKLEGHPGGESGHAHGAGGALPQDRWWQEQALAVETLALRWRGQDSELRVGKIKPRVGLDFHAMPGLYGYQILEAYEIPGRLGVAAAHEFKPHGLGRHRLDLAAFRADRSELSRTWITKEDRLTGAAGGPANTAGIESWALSYQGDGFGGFGLDDAWLDGLSYRIGYAHQEQGEGNANDEQRWSLGLEKRFQIGTWAARAVAERMAIDHLDGEADHDRVTLSAGLDVQRGPWQIAGGMTLIDNQAGDPDEAHPNQILHASLGYRLRNDLQLMVGVKDTETGNERRQRVGLGLNWHTHF